MVPRIRAIYRRGIFQPETPCNLPENSEVELLVQETGVAPPTVTDPIERRRMLAELVTRMQANPIPAECKIPTREELHARR